MTHNLLTKAQLGFFYENRKKLDDAIGQILGPGVHLHDISRSSDKSGDISTNSYGLRNPQANIDNSMLSVNSGGSKKAQKFSNDIFSNFNVNVNENRIQKLYKQNMDLQKKIMSLKDQNQQFKHKSSLWQKTKSFLVKNLNHQLKLNSIKYNSSDNAILQQFLFKLQNIMNKKQFISGKREEKDHILCEQQNSFIKKRLEQESKIVSKLSLEIEYLKSENNLLKNKQSQFKKQRKARIDQLEEGIEQKFNQIQKSLQQKTHQNTNLHNKIANLQSQIIQLKSVSSPLRKKDKTITTVGETNQQLNQIQLIRKMSKVKDDQINILKKQMKLLNNRVDQLNISNNKMKKVINLAQNLNNQFLNKLEHELKKSRTTIQTSVNDYGQSRQSFQKSDQNEESFHFANKKFKILKSRSVQKQRYMYGQKNKDKR